MDRIMLSFSKKKKPIALAIDFKNAYNTCSRMKLMQRLREK
jgi:hypothetical protein